MRFATLILLVLGLMTSSAWAENPPGHKPRPKTRPASVCVVNQVDGAILVRVNNGGIGETTLEPGASQTFNFLMAGGWAEVTIDATLVGTGISASNSARTKPGQTLTATITSPTPATLAISLSNLVAALFSRESGVVLASTGGLAPLVLLGMLLGRRPRRRGEFAKDQWSDGSVRLLSESMELQVVGALCTRAAGEVIAR